MPDPVCCVIRVGGVEEGAKEKGIEGKKREGGWEISKVGRKGCAVAF